MCAYDIARETLDADQKLALDRLLEGWSRDPIGRDIVEGIQSERFLSNITIMREFLLSLLEFGINIREDLNHYKKICRNCPPFQGGDVQGVENNHRLGNAVDKEKLINRLEYYVQRALLQPSSEPGSMGLVVDELLSGQYDGIYDDYPVGNYKMWSTWSYQDPEAPFGFLNPHDSPYEVRLCLALDPEDILGTSLLLLEYRRDVIGNLYRPTIVDADGYRFFRPPGRDYVRSGMTYVEHPELDYYTERLNGTVYNRVSCPEGVHSPITIGCLISLEERLYD